MPSTSLTELFTNRELLAQVVRAWGPWAPILFVVIQAVQVIFFLVPGELTGVVGGYVFGAGLGFVYSMIGLTLGTMATFALGHAVGPRFLRFVLGSDRFNRVRGLVARAGAPVAFVLYLIPGFPKDVLGYFFGASELSSVTFLVVTTVARIPGTWVLSLQGDSAAGHAWGRLLAVTGAAVVLGVLGYRYREAILAWVRRSRHPEG
jgi:uncharacterized membrane protein YdjX (TVP38/TMEM64 family)